MELIRNRNFSKYYMSRSISYFGDIFNDIAIMVLISNSQNATSVMSMIISINAIVKVLSSLILAKKIDALDAKKTMIVLDIIYGFLMIILICLLLYKYNNIYIIIFEIFFSLIFSIYKISRDKVLKYVISTGEKNRYISLIFTTENILAVFLPSLGSLLLNIINIYIFILINAISFFVSALFTSQIKINSIKYNREKNISQNAISFKNHLGIYNYIIIIYMTAIIVTIVSSTSKLIIIGYIKENNIINHAYYISLFQTVLSIGGIIGSIIVGYIKINNIKKNIKIISIIAILVLIPYVLYNNIIIFIITLLSYGIIFNLMNCIVQVFYQTFISVEHIGFIKSVHTIIIGLTVPISTFFINIIISNYSLRIVFIFFITLYGTYYLSITFLEKVIYKERGDLIARD